MIELYRMLAESLNKKRVRLDGLTTFNLDEYAADNLSPVPESHPLSYRRYMRDKFFSLLDPELGFSEGRAHFPDPRAPEEFDREIEKAGGIDFQLLGIGFNGHIAFNEPVDPSKISAAEFAALSSRVVRLEALTVATNARLTAKGEPGAVPRMAATMGMRQILAARRILLLACFPEQRAPLLKIQAGDISPALPASLLLGHPDTEIVYTDDIIKLD
jgi:glucosamine-6-phosphate deaminase